MGNLSCCPAGSCFKSLRRKVARRSKASTARPAAAGRESRVMSKNRMHPVQSVQAALEDLVEELHKDRADEEVRSLAKTDSRFSEILSLEDAWEELPGDATDKGSPEYTEVTSIEREDDWVLQNVSEFNSEDEAFSGNMRSHLGLSTWSLEVNYPGSIRDLEDFNEEQGMEATRVEPGRAGATAEPDLESGDEWLCRIHTDDLSSSDTCNVESLNLEELELPRPSEAWTTQEETQEQPRPSPGLC